MICKSLDHDIIIAFSLKHELRQTYRYKYGYKCSLVKNLQTHGEIGDENRETNKNILAQ